jgi:glutamine---fructose-6-phosphate transaminase (isomerizing)
MCGIFGVISSSEHEADRRLARSLAIALLRLSETRGREAAGIAVHDGSRIEVLKQGGSVTEFLANPALHELLDGAVARARPGAALAIVGHSRLATNGTQSNVDNNQPVITHGSVALHNGIVVNDRTLAAQYPALITHGELDSEVLIALLRSKLDRSKDLVAATRATFAEIEGSASIAMLFDNLDVMLLATNTGSLFQLTSQSASGTVIAFASERFILQRLLEDPELGPRLGAPALEQVRAGHAIAVQLSDLRRRAFSLTPERAEVPLGPQFTPNGHNVSIIDHSPRPDRLRRCTRCILPETYPFVDFDAAGVCHYCRTWKKIAVKGEQALLDAVAPYRSKDGSPDVILAFSGGRDSSYGLHYVKKELGMNPVAFTYDWGMVTDLARRNQARMCGKLGVEHIIRSADITAKRRYVRKNVEAWLRRPEIGMVTLFMAGDKEFYSYARQLRKETGIKLVVFCTGNMIEDAPYKTGLMGVPQDDHGNVLTKMSLRNKLGMLWYYAKNYARNPRYLNESLYDTANAFWQTFVVKDDFLYLYRYLEWREDIIVDTIRREYDWEVATDTSTTWRIGDGTAPFYNYIYHTIAGFTEDEVMLANMVREDHLTRAEALERALEYARPRWPSIREYAQLIGFSAEEALQIINAAPKLY